MLDELEFECTKNQVHKQNGNVPDFHWCWVCKGSDEVSLCIVHKDEQETTKKAPYLPSIGHTKEKKVEHVF